MKTKRCCSLARSLAKFPNVPGKAARRAWAGLTLVEFVVVFAILAGLAGLILPAIARFKARTAIHDAQEQISLIMAAIQHYEAEYGRLPVSAEANNTVAALQEDYTYGSTFVGDEGKRVVIGGPGTYLNNNNELIAILMDLEYYPNGHATLNKEHIKNPRRIKFLSPRLGQTTNSPGVGPDGAYRDPWGICFMITLDLNNDGKARDIFYRNRVVSEDRAHPERGLNGLAKGIDGQGAPVFEANARVMVWSTGPDKMINPEKPATEGVNRDNVLSWK